MERNNSKVRVFFIKILKILLIPIGRVRKLTRKCNIRQIKISIGVGVTIICIALVAYLYRLSIKIRHNSHEYPTPAYLLGTPIRRIPLDEIYKDLRTNEDKDYVIDDEQKEPAGMVNTPGCKIPVAMVDYEKYIVNTTNNKNDLCGHRAVFLRKYDKDKVIARIKTQILQKYAKNVTRIQCCYRFIIDSIQYPHERPKLTFSNCTDFQEETVITLESDFINVVCSEFDGNTSNIVYDDMYAFSKKIEYSKPKTKNCKVKYNVLMLGMDSMSLPRAVKTLPRTVAYLKGDSWLGFTGYHKIADNSLPNIMAVLTGKNMSSIIEACFGSMDDCNYLMMWNAFKEAGYVTAYSEDNLRLANTFTKEYEFRETQPTDHYMQPFFIKEESDRRNKSISCVGKVSSGQQLLDYALDFANTYKKDSFFGFFWINSFSYDEKSQPENADKIIENFMNQLTYTGVMANTFIIFFSDHGLRFGNHRLKLESYYDDRMPMNFMWIPLIFKGKHPYKLSAMAINQHRLITPYDIYGTLLDIKKISLCSNSSDPVPEGCPNCHSMFKVISSNRTCQDAAIHQKWCSCHKLYPLPIQDPIGTKSVNAVVNYIRSMVMTIETQRCWSCTIPSLKEVNRIHFYYDEGKVNIFYVVAITMSPGNATYEATVLRKDGVYHVIGPLSFISYYKGLGKCALNRRDRLFCVCQKQNC